MYRVLKENSACFIVVGDIKIKNEVVNMAELLARVIEEKTDFRISRVIYDPVPYGRKYMIYVPKEKGVKNDQILELHKGRIKERDTKIRWD